MEGYTRLVADAHTPGLNSATMWTSNTAAAMEGYSKLYGDARTTGGNSATKATNNSCSGEGGRNAT